MPNRILKESISTSPTVDELTAEEEVFFYRLLVACDDYGRFDARPPILRARCFPLRLDLITDGNIRYWLGRLQEVGLLTVYAVGGLPYLQLATWERHQQVRAKRSKFPSPDSADPSSAETCKQVIADASICPRNPIQSESNPNPNHVVSADSTTTEAPEPKFSEGDPPYDLSVHLRGKILGNDPKAKVPNATPSAMERWARDFDLLIRVDSRDPPEVLDMIEWSQAHEFWRTVCLSPGAYRKNFTKMGLQKKVASRANGRAREPVRDMDFYESDPYLQRIRENVAAEAQGKVGADA